MNLISIWYDSNNVIGRKKLSRCDRRKRSLGRGSLLWGFLVRRRVSPGEAPESAGGGRFGEVESWRSGLHKEYTLTERKLCNQTICWPFSFPHLIEHSFHTLWVIMRPAMHREFNSWIALTKQYSANHQFKSSWQYIKQRYGEDMPLRAGTGSDWSFNDND